MYGRDATYNAVEGQFRRYRKVANELLRENGGKEINPRGRANTTPRTPRTTTPRSGVGKSGTGKAKIKQFDQKHLDTPTKVGRGTLGQNIMDAINIETDTESTCGSIEPTIKINPDEEDDVTVTDGYQETTDYDNFKKEDTIIKKERKNVFSVKPVYVDSQTNGYVDDPQNRTSGEHDVEMGGMYSGNGNGNTETQKENGFDIYSDIV
jgi:hypothetical protein